MVWASGKQLQNGRYTIQELIGVGRFGVTYRAATQDGSLVVIKTPNDESMPRQDFDRLQQVFVKEAFKLAQCKHPHIVKAYEPFQEDGLWCIPMEYISGMPLSKRDCKVISESEALEYIRQIGEALQVVHANGLLHRDVCPANILQRIRNGKSEAVLIDFGLARNFEIELTQKRTEEISSGFSPPELYATSVKPGVYTDIYALGATLYDLVNGKKPPSAETRIGENAKLAFTEPIKESTKKAIIWAMEVEVQKRPQSMQEWLNALSVNAKSSASRFYKPKIKWGLVGAFIVATVGVVGGLAAAVSAWADYCGTVNDSWLCPVNSKPSPHSTPGTTP